MNKMKKNLIKKKKNNRFPLYSHLIILFILIGINIWDRIINKPSFPKNFLYLTQIDLYISILYYLFCLITDIFKKESKKYYHKFFNFCFTLSFIVFVMYWLMFFIDNSSLYKQGIQIPLVLTILLHGGVFICNLIEQIFIQKRKSPAYCNQVIYFFFTVIYIGMLSIINYLLDFKVYPFIYGSLLSFFIICIGGFLTSLLGHRLYMFLTRKNKKLSLDDNPDFDTDESLNSYNE